ncbi:bacteriophage T4 gp5 trimerisation domain-containing protein [Helicobacter trogontum]|uniref:VgrG protein n=2 Tax=Helicobacter trogontum TaxID=50960 RepID=A0A4U8T4E4_9HELI|nr:VgrG protein [Helicobacter trogontum]MDY5186357.1 VgrG protein [Helicobacter trogontum]TLD94371.1 VgrG protein [Helicobacter trogontum]
MSCCYNELTLSNLKDNEEIYIRAQKDYRESINNNFSQTIHNNKDSKVKGSYTESITKYHKQEILGLKDVRVGAEYLTNVALSKDTIVGLSHTLNVGVDNKLRVAHNSSEYVGGDKEIEIGNNLSSSIGGDKAENVRGNSVEVVEGQYHLQAKDSINMESTNETTFRTKGNLLITSNASMGLETDENTTFIANNILSDVATDYTIQAGNVINLNIGESIITASSDKITLKAGGVEVVIDSNGLVVKGGEIKAE